MSSRKAVRLYLDKEFMEGIKHVMPLGTFALLSMVSNNGIVSKSAFSSYMQHKASNAHYKQVRLSNVEDSDIKDNILVGDNLLTNLSITDYVNLCVYQALQEPIKVRLSDLVGVSING